MTQQGIRTKKRLAAMMSLAIAVVACSGSATPSPSPTPAAASTEPTPSAAASVAAASVAASPSPSATLGTTLVINVAGGTYGDAERTAYTIPFEAETGVNVVEDVGIDTQGPQLEAQVAAGQVKWDLAVGWGADYYTALDQKGLLEHLDYTRLQPEAGNLIDGANQPWGVGEAQSGWGVVFDSAKFPTAPTTVSDFFDTKKFPGPRMVSNWGTPEVNIIEALIADGVKPADLTPFDYKRAFAKLDTVKSDIKVYFESGNQMIQSLTSGLATICLCIDGRALQAIQLMPSLKMAWGGGYRAMTYWVIPKGAPHIDAAYAYLKSILQPARQAAFTSLTGYSAVVNGLYPLLTPERQAAVLINPANLSQTFALTSAQVAWLTQNSKDIAAKWTAWISK